MNVSLTARVSANISIEMLPEKLQTLISRDNDEFIKELTKKKEAQVGKFFCFNVGLTLAPY